MQINGGGVTKFNSSFSGWRVETRTAGKVFSRRPYSRLLPTPSTASRAGTTTCPRGKSRPAGLKVEGQHSRYNTRCFSFWGSLQPDAWPVPRQQATWSSSTMGGVVSRPCSRIRAASSSTPRDRPLLPALIQCQAPRRIEPTTSLSPSRWTRTSGRGSYRSKEAK